MKLTRILAPGMVALVVPAVGTGAPAGGADGQYAPLRAALAAQEEVAIAEAREARLMVQEYEDFLKDPETETEEKPELRKILLREESRHRNLRKEAIHLRAAIDELRNIPPGDELTLGALREAYAGLGDLGQAGRVAWDNLLADRFATIAALEGDYARELEEATLMHESLQTAERAKELLLAAIDPHRSEATDVEFEVALRLPRLKTAVELGFGISSRPDDEDAQAQATLVALVSYAQYFWDYYTDARADLADGEKPRDSARNVLGVPDGGLLLSDAIAENRSNYYYLAEEAKERFNGRIRAIWGEKASVSVTWWDQKSAPNVQRACEALSTTTDDALVPNEHAFALLALIDGLIEEKQMAEEKIESIHIRNREEIAAAKDFGERAALSSASFNALLWDRESEASIARFEAAKGVLDEQLAACEQEDWTPRPQAIAAGAQSLKRIQRRAYAIVNVKKELGELLE